MKTRYSPIPIHQNFARTQDAHALLGVLENLRFSRQSAQFLVDAAVSEGTLYMPYDLWD